MRCWIRNNNQRNQTKITWDKYNDFLKKKEKEKYNTSHPLQCLDKYSIWIPYRVGLVVSVSASHTVGREFASLSGHTKDHHKMAQTASLYCTHALGLTVQPDCLKGRVVCGTVYGDMHLKDLLGSIVRVEYRIPVPDFYLVLRGLRCRKSTSID